MHGSISNSRLALILRRLRGRFGIAAPRLAVRTHVPWYWRAMVTVILLTIALALAGWTYDAGRKFAGFDQSESKEEINALREKQQSLDTELERLRGVATASESNLQIEKTVAARLSEQVKTLEEENIRLKESLADYENLAGGGKKINAISLSRLRVEPDGAPGRYRYRILAARRGTQPNQEFKASLQLQVTLRQGVEPDAIITIPKVGDPEVEKYSVSIRSFRSIEGNFQIPADAKIKRVEARLIHDGAVQATQGVSL